MQKFLNGGKQAVRSPPRMKCDPVCASCNRPAVCILIFGLFIHIYFINYRSSWVDLFIMFICVYLSLSTYEQFALVLSME